jgi:hypothetical protein
MRFLDRRDDSLAMVMCEPGERLRCTERDGHFRLL